MRRIGILLLAGFSLFGCLEATKAVRRSPQEESVEHMLANMTGITPNSVVAFPHWLNKNTLAVDFLVYKVKVEPVFGIALNLNYDSEILKYLSYEKGGFLERGGKPTGNQKPVYLVSSTGNKTKEKHSGGKKLIIGAALFRGTPGVTGSGRLITLRFRIKQPKPTQIVITKGKLKNLQAKDITQIHWPSTIPIHSHKKRK